MVHLLTEEEGGSSHHNIPESIHDGYVTFSEVEGMSATDDQALKEIGLNINGSGPWWVVLVSPRGRVRQRGWRVAHTDRLWCVRVRACATAGR